MLTHPYLLQADDLTLDDIYLIFQRSSYFLENSKTFKKFDDLKGITVALAFFEASTRTKLSFELAAKRLSAEILSFQSAGSSLSKGESLIDTLKTIEAMGVQMYVVRHGCSGVPIFLQSNTNGVIINAGDGKHEHPTQALLDSFTLYKHFGKLEGVKIDEFRENFKEIYEKYEKLSELDKTTFQFADEENDQILASRFITFIREISITYAQKKILLVTH